MKPQHAFGCALSWLMRPKDLDQGHFKEELSSVMNPAYLVIGIHLRTGARSNDAFKGSLPGNRKRISYYDPWWECASGIESILKKHHGASRSIKWLFYSDSHELRRAVAAEFGSKIITCISDECKPEHTRAAMLGAKSHPIGGKSKSTINGLKLAASEQNILSLADAFLLSESSGFGRNSAVLRNSEMGVRPTFILNARNPVRTRNCSDPTSSLGFFELADIPGFL